MQMIIICTFVSIQVRDYMVVEKTLLFFIYLLSIYVAFSHSSAQASQGAVNVYSFRQAELINPLVHEFTKQTGIKVNIVSGKADKLMQRLIQDGDNSFADVLLTVDVARLNKAKQLNLIQPISSVLLKHNIPEQLRDIDNYWFGLSLRARTIFYAKDKVNPETLSSYSNLLDKKWQGKICSRTGSHFYNQSMVASFIYQHGEKWSEDWVEGFTNNLAMRPHGGDRDQLRKIARGECDVAVAYSYYYGMLSASEKQNDRDTYEKVGIIFPTEDGVGSHVNISGAALTIAAKNKANGIAFIEFLTTKEAQTIYANNNYESPVRTDMPAGELLDSWGVLTPDTKSIHKLPLYHKQAETIISKNNW
jgi:iron(III) transport system substrate-binding protein